MQSAVAVTMEIDDLDLAVSELSEEITQKLELKAHSVGIAYCDADVDVAKFGKLLYERLGVNIAGITTTGTIERHSGYSDMGILLFVLTADDVNFTIGVTGEMSAESFTKDIQAAYKKARDENESAPELILMFAPYDADVMPESYMDILSEASGSAPLFGGVATDHYELKNQKTFFNGRAFSKGLVFILFTGGVRPVFAMEHHFGSMVNKKGLITKSSGNVVQKVGDQTFKEFVETMVPIPEDVNVINYFLSTPFVVELPDHSENEQAVVRALCAVNSNTGAGSFMAKMPEGSRIYLNLLRRDNLGESCESSLLRLLNDMKESGGYEYSIIFISTCNARQLLMGDTKSLESDIVTEKLRALPDFINAAGCYGLGEICPTGKHADGTAKNRYHNISFALCAI